jgi:hypothetical protein
MTLYRSFPVTLAAGIPYGMVMVSVNDVRLVAQSRRASVAKRFWYRAVSRDVWPTVATYPRCHQNILANPTTTIACTCRDVNPGVPSCLDVETTSSELVAARGDAYMQNRRLSRILVAWYLGLSHTPAAAQSSWTTYEKQQSTTC